MGKAYKLGDTKNIVDSISTLSSTVSTHTNTKGNDSTFGHVKLSDNYTSSAGAAANNVGASSKAVSDAYSALQTSFQAGVDTIYNGFVNAGTTPTAKTPAALSTAVTTHGTARYNSGYSAGVTATKVGTAGTGDVLSGKTFTNDSSVGAAGTMANKSNTTQDGTLTSDDTYTYLGIPAAGYYNTGAKLRTLNSNLPKGTKTGTMKLSYYLGRSGSYGIECYLYNISGGTIASLFTYTGGENEVSTTFSI